MVDERRPHLVKHLCQTARFDLSSLPGLYTHKANGNGPVGIPAGLVSKAVHYSDGWRAQLTLTLTSLCR